MGSYASVIGSAVGGLTGGGSSGAGGGRQLSPTLSADTAKAPAAPAISPSYVGSAQPSDGIKAPDFASIFINRHKRPIGG